MPYTIRRFRTGYRVYSKSGTPLSKEPLSIEKATKQKTAATLTYLRKEGRIPPRKGGSWFSAGGSETPPNCPRPPEGVSDGGGFRGGDESYSLSDEDIQRVLGGVKLFKYPELHKMSSIEDAFDGKGHAMMLYLTEDESTGHWVCMIKRGDTIEYFDPYGGYKPDSERKWLTKEKQEELGQAEPTLSRMIKEGGYKVITNPYHFQREGIDINTCGRHCCSRLLLNHLPLPEYKKMITQSKVPADEFVTLFISQLLHK
jgi:hypothetical protein